MLGIKEAREGFENFLTHTSDFQSFGRYLETVPIYPVFLGVHCILVALALRSRESGKPVSFRFSISFQFNIR